MIAAAAAVRDCPDCGRPYSDGRAVCSTCRARASRVSAAVAAGRVPAAMTAADLIRHWSKRDDLYAIRRVLHVLQPLSDAERAAIAAWRRAEVESLPGAERATAWSVLQRA